MQLAIDDLVLLEDGAICLLTRDGPVYPLRSDGKGSNQQIAGGAVTCIDPPVF